MDVSQATFNFPGGSLPVGTVPRVVGTLLSLPEKSATPGSQFACDVVEIRADHVLGLDWLKRGQEIEAAGTPVILTVRIHAEGGKWDGPDTDRIALYRQALGKLSAVDVELRSNICPEVAKLAKAAGKVCIVSYHDFHHTPPLALLETVVTRAQEIGSVVKVVTLTEEARDVEILEHLLAKKWKVPLCVMGMGRLGPGTRISFPTQGSCLTYGYLDVPAAPGQLSAAEVVKELRATMSGYEKDFRERMEESD